MSTSVRRQHPRARAPLYVTLAQHLKDAIADGTYPVGSLLPGELELSEHHRVSRQTVREAMRILTAQGCLVRQPGIGTRVNRAWSPVRYTHSVNSFSDLERYAKDLRLVIDEVHEVVVSGALAQFVGCRESSTWLYVRGVRCLPESDEPVAFSETYIKPGLPDILDKLAKLKLGGQALHMLLEREYGETIERISQQIHAIAVNETIAKVLRIDAGSPGLEIRRRFFAPGGRLVMSGRVVHPASQYNYSTEFFRQHAEGE